MGRSRLRFGTFWSLLAVGMFAGASLLVAAPAEAGKTPKVEICHIPPGNPANAHTIKVSQKAIKAHLKHGDYLGPCGLSCEDTCDDGNACTQDYCDENDVCWHDVAVECSDGNDCTMDSCDPAAGCVYPPLPSGDPCTGAPSLPCILGSGVCDGAGVCELTREEDCCLDREECNDNDPCTNDECNNSRCENTELVCPSTACEIQVCNGGVCESTPVVCEPEACEECLYCDDELGWQIGTIDGCCTSIDPPDPRCDDQDNCTSDTCDGELCDNEICYADVGDCFTVLDCDVDCIPDLVEPANCDDNKVCTEDLCQFVGGCDNPPIDCDDGLACTQDLGCVEPDPDINEPGGCQYADVTNVDCEDEFVCTVNERCEEPDGCTFDDRVCDDLDLCTLAVGCFEDVEGGCDYIPAPCDDGDLCTDDSCDLQSGCVHSPAVCPAGELCDPDSGNCVPEPECTSLAVGTPCDGGDGDFCNSTCDAADDCTMVTSVDCSSADVVGDCQDPSCNPSNGSCNPTGLINDADVPVDGDLCTLDVCTSGVPSNPAKCASGEVCDPDTGQCAAEVICPCFTFEELVYNRPYTRCLDWSEPSSNGPGLDIYRDNTTVPPQTKPNAYMYVRTETSRGQFCNFSGCGTNPPAAGLHGDVPPGDVWWCNYTRSAQQIRLGNPTDEITPDEWDACLALVEAEVANAGLTCQTVP